MSYAVHQSAGILLRYPDEVVLEVAHRAWKASGGTAEGRVNGSQASSGIRQALQQLQPVVPMPGENWYTRAFCNFDCDHDGYISYEAFWQIIKQYHDHHAAKNARHYYQRLQAIQNSNGQSSVHRQYFELIETFKPVECSIPLIIESLRRVTSSDGKLGASQSPFVPTLRAVSTQYTLPSSHSSSTTESGQNEFSESCLGSNMCHSSSRTPNIGMSSVAVNTTSLSDPPPRFMFSQTGLTFIQCNPFSVYCSPERWKKLSSSDDATITTAEGSDNELEIYFRLSVGSKLNHPCKGDQRREKYCLIFAKVKIMSQLDDLRSVVAGFSLIVKGYYVSPFSFHTSLRPRRLKGLFHHCFAFTPSIWQSGTLQHASTSSLVSFYPCGVVRVRPDYHADSCDQNSGKHHVPTTRVPKRLYSAVFCRLCRSKRCLSYSASRVSSIRYNRIKEINGNGRLIVSLSKYSCPHEDKNISTALQSTKPMFSIIPDHTLPPPSGEWIGFADTGGPHDSRKADAEHTKTRKNKGSCNRSGSGERSDGHHHSNNTSRELWFSATSGLAQDLVPKSERKGISRLKDHLLKRIGKENRARNSTGEASDSFNDDVHENHLDENGWHGESLPTLKLFDHICEGYFEQRGLIDDHRSQTSQLLSKDVPVNVGIGRSNFQLPPDENDFIPSPDAGPPSVPLFLPSTPLFVYYNPTLEQSVLQSTSMTTPNVALPTHPFRILLVNSPARMNVASRNIHLDVSSTDPSCPVLHKTASSRLKKSDTFCVYCRNCGTTTEEKHTELVIEPFTTAIIVPSDGGGEIEALQTFSTVSDYDVPSEYPANEPRVSRHPHYTSARQAGFLPHLSREQSPRAYILEKRLSQELNASSKTEFPTTKAKRCGRSSTDLPCVDSDTELPDQTRPTAKDTPVGSLSPRVSDHRSKKQDRTANIAPTGVYSWLAACCVMNSTALEVNELSMASLVPRSSQYLKGPDSEQLPMSQCSRLNLTSESSEGRSSSMERRSPSRNRLDNSPETTI